MRGHDVFAKIFSTTARAHYSSGEDTVCGVLCKFVQYVFVIYRAHGRYTLTHTNHCTLNTKLNL